jgi:inosine/xanthosine triphosphatase
MHTTPLSIIVASHNPVKIATVERAYTAFFPELTFSLQGISVPSQVADQPMSDLETRT